MVKPGALRATGTTKRLRMRINAPSTGTTMSPRHHARQHVYPLCRRQSRWWGAPDRAGVSMPRRRQSRALARASSSRRLTTPSASPAGPRSRCGRWRDPVRGAGQSRSPRGPGSAACPAWRALRLQYAAAIDRLALRQRRGGGFGRHHANTSGAISGRRNDTQPNQTMLRRQCAARSLHLVTNTLAALAQRRGQGSAQGRRRILGDSHLGPKQSRAKSRHLERARQGVAQTCARQRRRALKVDILGQPQATE